MQLSFSSWLHAALRSRSQVSVHRPCLSELVRLPETQLPKFVRESEVALKYLKLLGMLDWFHFPDRPDQRFSSSEPPLPYAPFVAAYLVKIDQHIAYVADLWQYLVEHPALVWVLGFPLKASPAFAWGFDVSASLPTHRHLSRLLRTIPNGTLQYLLGNTVTSIQSELTSGQPPARFGECISLDTKHIIAWVKENNPKTYIETGRYDKTKQPAGDPDCRLGCKRKHNRRKKIDAVESLPPDLSTKEEMGEYYWGYGSGVVSTKVTDWGEFVVAELTQPFNQADVSYFKPLMAMTEQRLGYRPRFGALDAAFDAFYVYEYFAKADPPGFAAVPFVERGRKPTRQFDDQGQPLCQAGLAMSLRYVFWCKTTLIPHERGRFVCPLLYPNPTGETCTVQHAKWAKGGCVTTLATSPGSRLRYQVDRQSQEYKSVYKQRTASERINSQAVQLGIERPKLRNGAAITNHNTLTYTLINLHALQRIHLRKAQRIQAVSS